MTAASGLLTVAGVQGPVSGDLLLSSQQVLQLDSVTGTYFRDGAQNNLLRIGSSGPNTAMQVIRGRLDITAGANVALGIDPTTGVQATGELLVTGSTSLAGSLTVGSAALPKPTTLHGPVTMGALTATGTFTNVAAGDLATNLVIDGDAANGASITGHRGKLTLAVDGSANRLDISSAGVSLFGPTTVAGSLSTQSGLTVQGGLMVSDGASFAGGTSFSGDVTILGDLSVQGTVDTINEQNLMIKDKTIVVGQGATLDSQQHGAGLKLDSTSASAKHVLWHRSGSGAAVDGMAATGPDAAEWELLGGDLVLTRQLSGKRSVALRLKSGAQGTELDIVSISYDGNGNRTGERVLANFAPQA